MLNRWYRSRRNQIYVFLILIFCLFVYINFSDDVPQDPNLDFSKRESVIQYIERRLQDALKEDKGTGCEIPKFDPFSKEAMQFEKDLPKVVCQGTDWVKCYVGIYNCGILDMKCSGLMWDKGLKHSECRVVKQILETTKDIECAYRDIVYENDQKYFLADAVYVPGDEVYTLTRSDHVKVRCTGKHKNNIFSSKWVGHCIGFRSTISPEYPPEGREHSLNVLIVGFDSTSRHGFIRRMPKSYKVLTEVLRATILNGYNIVGDGTPAALFPILSGKTELEFPDVRIAKKNKCTLDPKQFIFYKMRQDGYRTAYFEDMPWVGTFQYRFNGFSQQPADHYLRSFYLEESSSSIKKGQKYYCVGDTPQYKLMLNITDQFLNLDGKKFCFMFIADITHDDFNMITTADEDFAEYLEAFKQSERAKNTLLVVMGDHGPRYAKVRDTIQGKLEERLPLMAILLPESLKRSRPDAQKALEANAEVLTTAHDIHATVLDVVGLTKYWNSYKVQGADLTRAMTLLEPITKNRSCSEAGIEPHWCACLSWENVSNNDQLHEKAAHALVDYINSLTEGVRSKCLPRTLTSIEWVMKQRLNNDVLSFVISKDEDGYVGKFGNKKRPSKENYQVKIVVGPGRGVYEASLTYFVKDNVFHVDSRDISRTNAYNNEPSCISETHPHLNKYCYCNH